MSKRIDPGTLVSQPELRDVCISPDGKHVVYTSRPLWNRDGDLIKTALWTAEVGKQNSAKQLTKGDYNDFSPAYSPDGRYISFISDRPKPGVSMVLHLLPVDGGEAFPLTPTDNEMGIGSYQWRPDSKSIAFASADEKSEERKAAEKESDANVRGEAGDRAKLRLIDVESKEVKVLQTAEGHVIQLTWNGSGTKIGYITWREGTVEALSESGTKIHIVDVQSNKTREVYSIPTHVESLAWSKEKLVFVGFYDPNEQAGGKSVYTMDPTQEPPECTRTSYGQTNCANALIARSGQIVVKVYEGLKETLTTLDGRELFGEKTNITSFDANFISDRPVIALTHSIVGKPTEVYSFVDGQKVQLTEHGRDLTSMELGEARLCEYTHEDGTPIDGYYGVPTSLKTAFDNGDPSPTIVLVHGGPYDHVSNSFDLYWSWTPFFMSLGYLVLVPNYRGGAGHGHAYANVVAGDGSTCYQDVEWLVKRGIKEGRIDPERVGLTGWSYGGYIAYLALTRDIHNNDNNDNDDKNFHFAAIAPGAGITDMTTMCLTSDIPIYWSYLSGPSPWSSSPSSSSSTNDPLHNIQARHASPLYHLQNVTTPALLLHGEADTRVPVEQAVGFYRGLKARGGSNNNKEVSLVTYRNESHCFPVPWYRKNNVDMLLRLEKFFAKYLGTS